MLHIERPDNLTWSPDGKLLAASHTDSLIEDDAAAAGCRSGRAVRRSRWCRSIRESMDQFAILGHRGAPIGGVSVALRIGDVVYLGSFAGDRIARWHVIGETP